jgi:ADP-heptose:LPS heptosyltransferase
MPEPLRILVIRRDNIGDLVCTTPLLRALRARHPDARLTVLANAYNAPVLEGNPDIDAVFSYRKAKHEGLGLLTVLLERLRLVLRLRAEHLDWVLVATPAWQPRTLGFARWLGARRIAAFCPPGRSVRGLSNPVPLAGMDALSEPERVYRLGAALGLPAEAPPPLRVVAAPETLAQARRALRSPPGPAADAPVLGLHIRARKPSQRWPVERFAALMRALGPSGLCFAVFWAPGPADDPRHPGDDGRAAELAAAVRGLPVVFWPTRQLRELTAGLAACDALILSDGGAMHIAAGLGKPLVCLFGQSDAKRWRPWHVPCRVLQPASRNVSDITVAEVGAAYTGLMEALAARRRPPQA